MDSPSAIATTRLILRDYTPADAAEALVINADEEVMRYLGGVQHRTVDEIREFLECVAAKYARYRERGLPHGAWAVRERDGGALVGTALLKPLPDAAGADTDAIEVGWHLARAAWGKGYATEFGKALLERGFSQLDVQELHAVVDPGNVRSEAVAKRLGFTHRGLVDAWYGKTFEHFTLERAEWFS